MTPYLIPIPKQYMCDLNVSDKNGFLINTWSDYLPSGLRNGSIMTDTNIDLFHKELYAGLLYASKEPILYNCYLQRDIYRFVITPEGSFPRIVSLNKDTYNNKYWISIKILDRNPEVFKKKVVLRKKFIPPDPDEESSKGLEQVFVKDTALVVGDNYSKNDSIIFPKRYANFSVNKIVIVTKKEWDNFEQILARCDYWNLLPYQIGTGSKMTNITLEAHLKDRYWFVTRIMESDELSQCGNYLLKIAKLN